jgi:hypothetical protein
MKLHVIFIAGFALMTTGCAEKEQVDEVQVAAPATEASTTGNESWNNDDFLEHMHVHAEKLDDLNYALADGDLERAKVPAYWLSQHDSVGDVQSDWLPYLYGMRTEARAVEEAPDLDTARAAAERISAKCQGCHVAAGVATE